MRKLIRPRRLLEKIPFSRTTLWRLRRAGKFPNPIQLSDGAVAYDEDEVDRYIEARRRARDDSAKARGLTSPKAA